MIPVINTLIIFIMFSGVNQVVKLARTRCNLWYSSASYCHDRLIPPLMLGISRLNMFELQSGQAIL